MAAFARRGKGALRVESLVVAACESVTCQEAEYGGLGEGRGYLACQDDHVVRHRCCRLGCQPEVDTFELNAFCL